MGILQARILEWATHFPLQGIFATQGWNLGLLHCRQILYHLSHQESQILNDAKANERHSCVSRSTGALPRKLVSIIFDIMHTVLYK